MKSKLAAIFVLFLLVLSTNVFADGGAWIRPPGADYWQLLKESQQLTAINYKDGFQNMIITIDFEDIQGEEAVWLFPVPALPEKTAIGKVDGFPLPYGTDIKQQADRSIANGFSVMRATQIYPLFFSFYGGISYTAETAEEQMGIARGSDLGVTVHEIIVKEGLATELITAEDGSAFYAHLETKGLNLPENAIRMLDEYVDQEYSFVVSWIYDIEEFKAKNARVVGSGYYYPMEQTAPVYGRTVYTAGVSITFPTDKIYFPLKPTSVYGSEEIPILIYVFDHVTPELYPEISRDSEVKYYVQNYFSVEKPLESFFNGESRINEMKFTTITFTAPSKYFVDDLWISSSAPADVAAAGFIIDHPWIWGVIFFILSSCLASLLSGAITFRKLSRKKLALFGLWNFLTIIGFIVATIFLKTREIKPELKAKLKSYHVVVTDDRKILFVFLFTIFFMGITFIFQALLSAII